MTLSATLCQVESQNEKKIKLKKKSESALMEYHE